MKEDFYNKDEKQRTSRTGSGLLSNPRYVCYVAVISVLLTAAVWLGATAMSRGPISSSDYGPAECMPKWPQLAAATKSSGQRQKPRIAIVSVSDAKSNSTDLDEAQPQGAVRVASGSGSSSGAANSSAADSAEQAEADSEEQEGGDALAANKRSKRFSSVLDLTARNKESYAARHGYTYIDFTRTEPAEDLPESVGGGTHVLDPRHRANWSKV